MAKSDFLSTGQPERIIVSGKNARAEWERIKAEGRGWPIVVGDDKQLDRVMGMLGSLSTSPADILARAEKVDFPNDFEADIAARWVRTAENIKADLAKPDEELTDLNGISLYGEVYDVTPQERKNQLRRQLEEGPFPIGEWPNEPLQHFESPPFIDYRGNLLPEVNILLMPVKTGPEVFAYLNYTAGSGPEPEYHVAALNRWHASLDAELFVLNWDTLVFRVKRHPQTREEALRLARERAVYCNSEERPLAHIAHEIMYSDEWFFWWD